VGGRAAENIADLDRRGVARVTPPVGEHKIARDGD
jgi:hypothetical protein